MHPDDLRCGMELLSRLFGEREFTLELPAAEFADTVAAIVTQERWLKLLDFHTKGAFRVPYHSLCTLYLRVKPPFPPEDLQHADGLV